MKNRITTIIIVLCMILTALPLSVSAIADNDLPFNDVTGNAWYYDAVCFVYRNGYFSGVSDTEFGPDIPVTRGMFVTVLSKLDDTFIPEAYDGITFFKDVKADSWYSKAVQWAFENNYVSGTSEDTFSPDKSITREELAVIYYSYITKNCTDPSDGVKPSDLDKFGDVDLMHDWSYDAIRYLSHYKIMNGKGIVSGAPMFDPAGCATRAEVAQILKTASNTKFSRYKEIEGTLTETKIDELTLNGNPIYEYTIVYGETAYRMNSYKFKADRTASVLRDAIKLATGYELLVYKDTEREEISDKEIRIGKTNRETLLPVDRSGLEDDSVYYELIGNTLIIASSEDYCGTICAMYDFLQRELGFNYYGEITAVTPCAALDVPSGAAYRYTPLETYRMNYNNKSGAEIQYHNATSGMHYREVNLMHTLMEFTKDDFVNEYSYHLLYYKSESPCLTDEHNIDNIIKNVRKVIQDSIDQGRDCNMIWVSQPDHAAYCKCENCVKVYRTWGRYSTYTHVIKYICDAIRDEYPDWYVLAMAYEYSIVPPRTDVTDDDYSAFLDIYGESKYIPSRDVRYPDNSIMCVCTDNACSAHAINDPVCKNPAKNNVTFCGQLQKWSEICGKIMIWDYIVADNYKHQAFPNFNQMYYNFKLYNELGVMGTYVLGHESDYGDFMELRSYLVSKLQWEDDMTWEEYSGYINGFLKGFYGSGWTYIREYIDLMQDLSYKNEWNIWGGNNWNRMITIPQYTDNIEYMKSLWQKAYDLALADGDYERYIRCLQTGQEVWYAALCLEYQKTGGEYSSEYQKLFDEYSAILDEAGLEKPSSMGNDPNSWRFD